MANGNKTAQVGIEIKSSFTGTGLKDANKNMGKLISAFKVLEKQSKSAQGISVQFKAAADEAENIRKKTEAVAKEFKNIASSAAKYGEDAAKPILALIKKAGEEGSAAADDMVKKFNKLDLLKDTKKVQEEIAKIADQLGDAGEEFLDNMKGAMDALKKGVKVSKAQIGQEVRDLEGAYKAMGMGTLEAAKTAAEQVGKKHGIGADKAMSARGGKLGMASSMKQFATFAKSLKGGIIGAIVTSFIMLRKGFAETKSSLLDMQAAAGYGGQTIYNMSKIVDGVHGNLDDFGSIIKTNGRNFRVSTKEYMTMAKALTSAGVRFDEVFSKNSKAIEGTVVTASILGITFEDSAELMNTAIMGLGLSVTDAAHAFAGLRKMSSMTGVTTGIFTKGVLESTKSLQLYNANMGQIATSFRQFLKLSNLPRQMAMELGQGFMDATQKLGPGMKAFLLKGAPGLAEEIRSGRVKALEDKAARGGKLTSPERLELSRLRGAKGKGVTLDTAQPIFEAATFQQRMQMMSGRMKGVDPKRQTVVLREMMQGLFGLGPEFESVFNDYLDQQKAIADKTAERDRAAKGSAERARLDKELAFLTDSLKGTQEAIEKQEYESAKAEAIKRRREKVPMEQLMYDNIGHWIQWIWGKIESFLSFMMGTNAKKAQKQMEESSTLLVDSQRELSKMRDESQDLQSLIDKHGETSTIGAKAKADKKKLDDEIANMEYYQNQTKEALEKMRVEGDLDAAIAGDGKSYLAGGEINTLKGVDRTAEATAAGLRSYMIRTGRGGHSKPTSPVAQQGVSGVHIAAAEVTRAEKRIAADPKIEKAYKDAMATVAKGDIATQSRIYNIVLNGDLVDSDPEVLRQLHQAVQSSSTTPSY
jgi:hypothetical protein